MAQGPTVRERPKLIWRIWRPHLTMIASFSHRITGVGLYIAALLAAGWAFALASGPGPYAQFKVALGSWPGKALMVGLTFSLFFHLGGGIRHLVFDAGYGFRVRTATWSAIAVLAFALVATIAIWAFAFAVGAA